MSQFHSSRNSEPKMQNLPPDELFSQNIEFLKEKIPPLHKIVVETTVSSDLVFGDDGNVNIRRANGDLVYKFDAKIELEQAVQKYIKNPSRIVIGEPAKIEQDFEEPKPKFGGTWPTSKYDDQPQDFHYLRYLCNVSNGLREAGVKYGSTYIGSCYYFFIYGIGAGYQILPLLKHYRPKVLLLIDEDRDGFVHSTSLIDWEEIFNVAQEIGTSIKITTEANALKLAEAVRSNIMSQSLLGLDGLNTFIHGPSTVLRAAYQSLMDPKSANMASFIGFLTDEYNMMKNSFRNLSQGTKRILSNAEIKLRKPILIVGSGPSLEKNIDFVKKHQNDFIIFTSGSNLRILFENGIVPDLHCNLERASSILKRHEELDELGYSEHMKKVVAIMTTTIWPGIDRYFKDTVYFIRPALSPLGVFAENYEQVLFNEGPQVTNTAFAFSRRIAAKKIYLLGVDLGTTDQAIPRSSAAWEAQRPRKLTIPIRGTRERQYLLTCSLSSRRIPLSPKSRNYWKSVVSASIWGTAHLFAAPRQWMSVNLFLTDPSRTKQT